MPIPTKRDISFDRNSILLLENQGIDPCASRMRSGRSTNELVPQVSGYSICFLIFLVPTESQPNVIPCEFRVSPEVL